LILFKVKLLGHDHKHKRNGVELILFGDNWYGNKLCYCSGSFRSFCICLGKSCQMINSCVWSAGSYPVSLVGSGAQICKDLGVEEQV